MSLLCGHRCNSTKTRWPNPTGIKNNVGMSFILILGEYTGGRLIVPSRGIATPAGSPCTALYIDGRETHSSERAAGLRYSIVAFVHKSAPELSPRCLASLSNLGFRMTAPGGQSICDISHDACCDEGGRMESDGVRVGDHSWRGRCVLASGPPHRPAPLLGVMS